MDLPPLPLLPPITSENLKESFQSYETSLARLDQPALFAELARVNGALQQQAQSTVISLLQREPSSAIDQLDQLSPMTDPLSDEAADRPRPSQPYPERTTSLQLLSGTSRLGPRLAAKLVVASSRARANRMMR